MANLIEMIFRRKIEFLIWVLFFLPLSNVLTAQEALKSTEEEYFDFLALQGILNRPALNYRTLSDSVWNIDKTAEHPWQNQNLGTFFPLFGDFRIRIYGPELFMSFNTDAPYGQNDGVLWQGRGLNSSLTSGIRFEGYGIELTLKPKLAFSQNTPFDIMPSNYDSEYGYFWGYLHNVGADAPQRFGNEPLFAFDWGDTEIRYFWKTLTAGFGTQAIWLGPAYLNPILHSNNAPAYPKFDIGLRRQRVTIPWLGWYLGDVEARFWVGRLSESDFFDNDSSNDHNLITGLAIAYSFPSLLKGLTVGFNRIMLSKWDAMNIDTIFTLLWPFMEDSASYDKYDQRASIFINYFLPLVGINVYLDWGRNDYSPEMDYVIRYPFHTEAYTVGVKKTVPITRTIKGEILLEITKLEGSQDYDRVIPWYSTFYFHHFITQGHTNQGQWLGAGIGTGGNSQYLGFKLYFPKGYGNLFVQRRNPDLDYTWYIDSKKYSNVHEAEYNIRAFLDFGISGLYFIMPNLNVSGSLVFRDEHNPLNKTNSNVSVHRYNLHLAASIKYSF
jgi:hypothetical protein